MNKNNLFIIGAILALILMFTSYVGMRADKPIFDGVKDNFSLAITTPTGPATINQPYAISLAVTNKATTKGAMYVQCSILDRNKYTFLTDAMRQTAVPLPPADNCVINEPFTQTQKVTLDPSASEQVNFVVTAPVVDAKAHPVIYCSAYEQCWAKDVDPMTSDEKIVDVGVSSGACKIGQVISTDCGNGRNITFAVCNEGVLEYTGQKCSSGQSCSVMTECTGWLTAAFTDDRVQCLNQECVYDKDPKTSNTVTQWIKDNYFVFIGLVVLIVGLLIYFFYYKPKKVNQRYM